MPNRVSQRIVTGRGRLPARRSTAWTGSITLTAVQALAAASVVLDQVFVPTVAEQTITRVRGLLSVQSDQLAAGEDAFGAFGMAVVEEPAATAGVASLPHPMDDSSSEAWFVWQPFSTTFVFGSAVGFDAQGGNQYVIDSKAMRKINNEQRVVILLQNSSSAFGMAYWFTFRLLSILKS